MSLQVNMFDPKFVGYSFPTKTVKVEEGKLRFFSKTIGETNPIYFDKDAARKAKISNFIESLPNGYNTMVGERGLKLSGGEKQRIGIARTILKDASIMLLDESTSSLDYTTEKKILANLKKDKKNSTMIVISHRLSAITDVDKIIVLNFGNIIEQGSHFELMNKEGEYFKLWQNQDIDMIN